MKSPPADIFIWGVHPSTTIEDIVNDLAASDITVESKDVLKKSKGESNLCSYKISVPAPDLVKALDPSIWPMRVKVREYVYYSNRSRKPREEYDNQDQNRGVRRPSYQQQKADQMSVSVPTFSRFAGLAGLNVPDQFL